jgi:hypothetical protein
MDNCIRESIDGMGRTRRTLCALVCALTLLSAPGAVLAEGTGGTAKEGGLGAVAAITNLIYGPVKIVYAVGGTTIAGFAWCFSGGDAEVASTVLTRAVRGTYVITPETLQGKQSIEFVGRKPGYREAPPDAQVAAAPDGW